MKHLFPSTSFSRLPCTSFPSLLLFASKTGITLIQQEPPWRLNYWQWHLIYWKGGRQRVYFRSNCLYEESPWTLQMLRMQIKRRYMSPLFLWESSTALHNAKQSSPGTNVTSAGWINDTNASTSEVTHYPLSFAPYINKMQTIYQWETLEVCVMCSPTFPAPHSRKTLSLYTNILCIWIFSIKRIYFEMKHTIQSGH